MKVYSKYDIGDEVWFMSNNKVQSCIIRGVIVNMEYINDALDVKNTVEYILNGNVRIQERVLYPNKEELLKSL